MKCKICGVEIKKGEKVCPSCGSTLKMAMWKKLLIGFGVFVLAVAILGGGEKSKNGGTGVSYSKPSVSIPARQQAFIDIITRFRGKYSGASNELNKSSTKRDRDAALSQVLGGNGNVTGWVGKLVALKTTGKGNAHISVKLEGAKNILVQTWNNELSDIMDHTLIAKDSILYNKAASLSVGNMIKFNGYFLLSNDGAVAEQSVSEYGSMNEPEFTFMFTDVSVY